MDVACVRASLLACLFVLSIFDGGTMPRSAASICVLIELVTSRNFLPGSCEQQQIEAICQLCGTPTESVWSGVSSLPNYHMIADVPKYPSSLRHIFKNFTEDFIALLEGLLTLNPKKRWTAEQVLTSAFFTSEPLPCAPEKMPGYQSIHVLEAIQKRMKQEQEQQKLKQQQQQTTPTTTITKQTASSQTSTSTSTSSTFDKQQVDLSTSTVDSAAAATSNNNAISNSAETTPTLQSSSSQRESLKRSFDLVNDIRNYCTSESDDEDEYDVEYEIDDEYYTDDDECEDDCDDCDDCEDFDESDEEEFYACETYQLTTAPSSATVVVDPAINQFLQPAKKQRTSGPTVATSLGTDGRIDIPIH
ncbi:hypothetical protein SAMD00019534_024540 [Acytostelium subglobosum LB1]|uniref:hypothetical protein n=1 Tax=Acytostelium subglobosum LB1 TaxID=1410327 RepID=UPI000644B6ED|nr:hypothetical protein SAMD00019534_024540 [Acytostelium subglobosum LB1]GAM19279.1 hypothetical protein SAMD00019534_024540 [Acytostelium subglobosum LB1]|eukprot:XP_012757206.1 hypothetical protein SAMD00019534_024540 [Acytostelium subglobosum LB1]